MRRILPPPVDDGITNFIVIILVLFGIGIALLGTYRDAQIEREQTREVCGFEKRIEHSG